MDPNGQQHAANDEDLFFSTTDAKGVIMQANETFVRVARSPREKLIGAPHNIIRHPDMPGGAFKIVWDELEAGRPVCAYVKNLAGDGSTYWAFATIGPLNNGYLSVRTNPAVPALRDAADSIYDAVRPQELAARDSGTSARDAAALGETKILEALAGAGFASYRDFMMAALTAEVEARHAAGNALPDRPEAAFMQRQLLASVRRLQTRVDSLGSELNTSGAAADELSDVLTNARNGIAEFDRVLQEAQQNVDAVAERAPLLANASPSLHQQCVQVRETMDAISGLVDEQRASRSTLRFSVALAQLQVETVGRFVITEIDGIEDHATSADSTARLVQALQTVMGGVQRDLDLDVAHSSALLTEVSSAAHRLKILDMLLVKWAKLVSDYKVEGQLSEQLPALRAAADSLAGNLSGLEQAVQKFGASSVSFDKQALDVDLQAVLMQARTAHA